MTAKAGCWFDHPAFELPGEDCFNEWLEPIDCDVCDALEA